jgi:hypothetical protein
MQWQNNGGIYEDRSEGEEIMTFLLGLCSGYITGFIGGFLVAAGVFMVLAWVHNKQVKDEFAFRKENEC